MVCMAGLQVFIVRFFFQVCCPSVAVEAEAVSSANGFPLGREKRIRVNDWAKLGTVCHGSGVILGKYGIGGVEILCTFTTPP